MNPTQSVVQLAKYQSLSEENNLTEIPGKSEALPFPDNSVISLPPKISSRSASKKIEEFTSSDMQEKKINRSSEPRIVERSSSNESLNSNTRNVKSSPVKNKISKKLSFSGDEMQKMFFNFANLGDIVQLNKILNFYQHKFNINEYDADGETALTKVANTKKNKFYANNLGAGSVDILNALITFGADLNKKNKAGDTPLIVATKANNVKIFQILLESGADPQLADFKKYTPLKWAAHIGMSAIIEELIYFKLHKRRKIKAEQYENSGNPYFKSGSKINSCGEQVHPNRVKQVNEAYYFGLTGKPDPNALQVETSMSRALQFANEAWPRKISSADMEEFEEAMSIAKKQGNNWTVQILRAHGVNG